jgi:two-component system NtrC family sensor kinase
MSAHGKIDGPYIFGLEHVPLPAVACDRDGRINWANDHFIEVIGVDEIDTQTPIYKIVEFEGIDTELIPFDRLVDGAEAPFSVVIGENVYSMYVTMVGELAGCVFAPELGGSVPRPSEPTRERVSIVPPTGNRLLESFITLSRELNLTMREEDLIKLFVQTYEDLFPDRMLCIRLVNPENMSLLQVYANGRLKEHLREVIQLTETSCAEHGLLGEDAMGLFKNGKMVKAETYETIFEGASGGFDVPLYDGSTFYGVLNFEYPDAVVMMKVDQSVVAPLAHQMCAALRNARLLAETIVLKDYSEKILDQANAPMVVIDRKGLINRVNQAFERLTGYDRDDILGIDFITLLPDMERVQAKTLSAGFKIIRGESVQNFEVQLPRADGQGSAHIAFNIAVIDSSLGEPELVILVGQDLTEIRALEKQIIHSEKLATLGQVAAGVAHELNNPLTSITVYASYLDKKLEGQIDEADLTKVKRIVQGAGRIQKFTRDLVTYARPSGEEPVSVNISELLETVLSFCEHFIAEARADVTLNVDKKLILQYAIRGQLEQVFVNLVTNACHALGGKGGTIRIDAATDSDGRARIVVADSGHGISEDRMREVFEPFYTTKPEGKGTGLGLSIVRNILLNHEGEIDVTSKIGQGTTFTILI